MRNPFRNARPSSWMKLAAAKWRGEVGRLVAAAGGLEHWQRWAIGALICAITIGSISLVAHAGGRASKKEETRAAASDAAAKAEATAAKGEPKNTEANSAAPRSAPKAASGGTATAPKKAGKPAGKAPAPKPQGQVIPITPPTKAEAKDEDEHEEDNVRARAQWFHDQRAYPLQHIPSGAFQKAIQQRDAMKLRQKASSGLHPASVITFPGDGLWHLTGPQPTNRPFGNFTGAGNSGFPTTSGRVTAVAVDPADATGNTVYIGGAAGGVWKTTDGGTTWKSLTDSQPSLAIGSIAIDPNNHLTIYVGTGEDDFNHDGFYGAGILKSTDGGNTWTVLGASIFAGAQAPGVGGAQVGAIAVQPGNSNVVLAAVDFFDGNDPRGGVYQSLDGGTTWIRPAAGAQGAAGTGVVFEPTSVGSNTAIAYAALGDIFSPSATNNGIWKSIDSGAHWTKQAGGLPTTNVGRITLGYAASTSGVGATVYAAIADSSTTSSDLLGFFKTTNGGTAWSQLNNTPAFCNHQCFYDIAIGVDPRSANNVVIGGGAFTDNFTSLFESKDGGTTWTGTAADDFAGPNGGTHPHVDTHAIVFTPSGATLRLYVGDDGGMWRTDNPLPAGVSPTWVDLNTQLAITQFYPNPSVGLGDENSAFGGTQDNDTQAFSGTLDWTAVQACGDGASTAVDTLFPTTVYTTCAPGSGPGLVARSVFNGAVVAGPNPSFAPVDTGITSELMEFSPPLTIDSNNPATLYFATCRLWQTTTGEPTTDTTTWTAITGDLASGTNTLGAACAGAGDITSMDVSHQSSGIVFAGTSNGKVWKTLDATAGAASSWTEFDNGLLPGRFVTAVRTERSDSTGNIAFVTFSGFGSCAGCDGKGHVFATTNGGATWSDISGDLPDAPVNDILVYHQGSPTFDALYIASDVGVFSCENPTAATPCQNWTVIGDGLPNSPVQGLAMRRSSRILRAFTHGRSAWHIQLTDVQPPSVSSLSSLTPAAVMVGAATTQVTVTGVNFSSNTQLLFDGIVIPTTFVNTTQLTATVNTNLFSTGIVYNATVSDPAGAETGSLPFTVMNPVPTATTVSISPTPTLTNDPVTLQFSGTGFVPGTVVTFNNFQVFGGTASGNGTIFTVTVPAIENTTAGMIPVAIYNPLPGGGFAGSANITITANPLVFNPSPIIQLGPINVGSTTAVLNVSITNVGATSISISVQSITGTNATNFNFAAPTSGTSCNFPTSGQSGTGSFTLTAGVGTCNFGMTFFANPATGNIDSTATLNVTDTAADSPQHIPIIGLINGAANLVTLSPVAFGGVAVGTTSPTMNATLFNLGSSAVNVTTAFTIAGTNQADFHLVPFVASGDGNAACPTTVPFMLNPLTACDTSLTFTPSLPAGNEIATINVTTSASATQLSANLTGTGIELTSISPSVVATGGPAFTLTVNGGGFAPSAVVNVNGSSRLTTFVSATQLLASIPASDIATAGSLAISVTTPVPGGTASEPKTLIVAQASPGTNDNINFATNAAATLPFRITEDTTQATVNTGGVNDPTPACAPGTATQGGKARSVWFTATPPVSGRVIFDTRFSSYTTIVSGWTGTPGSLVAVPGACFSGNVAGTTPATLVGVPVTAGTKYYMMVSDASASGAGGTLTFSLDFASAAPANDAFTNAINASPTPFTNTVNSIEATINTGGADPTPSCAPAGAASGGIANSVWYKFTAPSAGTITADTLTSPYETILTAVTGTPGSFTQVACNASASAGIAQSQVSFAATSATTYFFMVSAVLGDGGTTNFHLTFSASAGSAPTVSNVSPASGPAAGGTSVTITGTNFTGTTAVKFGATAATTFTVNSATQITATSPAGAGTVDVTVTTPGGTSATSAADKFTYTGPPTVTSVSPTSGPTAGGTVVTITGTNFTGTTAVKFGATTATTFTVNSATQITATSPAGAGTVDVTVTTPGGTSATSAADQFTYVGAPTKVVFTTQPTNVVAGASITPSVQVTLEDASGNPVTTATNAVTIGIGTNPSGGTLSGTLVRNAVAGVATFPGLSINKAGSNYTLTASAGAPITGATSTAFNVVAGTAASIATSAGTPQSVAINLPFATPLQVSVTDGLGNGVSGVLVTFAINPAANGASGAFTGTNTATTNAQGLATANAFTANGTSGTYSVVASAAGIVGTATFTLTNLAGAPASITAASGTPQTVNLNTAFATLKALVKDVDGNPVSGAVVTFTAPSSGASGTFVNGTNTVIANTDATGTASATTFTANFTNGAYVVNATVAGVAAPAPFSLTNTAAAPTITSLSPTSATAGGAAFVLTVNGTNFATTSVVSFNGVGKTTTFVSSTQLTAAITAADIATAATVNVSVTTPGPGGGSTGSLPFNINNPLPTITSLAPPNTTAGGAGFVLTVNGTNFVAASQVSFNNGLKPTTFKSATQLTATITAADILNAGIVNVTVTNPGPGGGTSTPAAQFTINNAQPALASLVPASTLAGGPAFQLTINGSGFVSGATVTFNEANPAKSFSPVATFVNSGKITAAITAAEITSADTFNVTVTNPPPSVGPSLALTFTINNPVPTLTTLGQTHGAGGTAFNLTVNGTNFVATSVVMFGTKAETTTLVSPMQVTAAIPATDVATAGPVNVTVVNPTPGGGPTPTSITFTVDGFTIAGPGSAVTVKAGVTASIPITITPTANGFANQVTFSVTGLPAHASLVPLSVTPGATKSTVNLMIMTTARSAAPPASPMDEPLTPMLRMLLVSWIAALLAGLYAARLIRRTPRLRRYAAMVPLTLLLVSGAVLAGCASAMKGTPPGTSQLTITATSGTFSQSTPNPVMLTVQ